MNVGQNKGRRLRAALSRFSAMLIEEARDISGMSFSQLDEKLDIPEGQSYRYSLYPMRSKTRAPQAGGIQGLENRVAKLLKRSAHTIVVLNNAKLINTENIFLVDTIERKPSEELNLREFDGALFELGYEGDWPTYRHLKLRPENLRFYAWQWGIRWDKDSPWCSREAWGIHPSAPIESFWPELTSKIMQDRKLISILQKTSSGRRIEAYWKHALLTIGNSAILDEIYARVLLAAEATEKLIKRGGVNALTDFQSDDDSNVGIAT